MHKAAGGSFEGKYVRDLRRKFSFGNLVLDDLLISVLGTTVHDASSTAWGLNEKVDTRPGFNSNGKSPAAAYS
jgi:alpha-ketoglutarate-dependent 2,4-dichlorophenoxyacetate dioxygenase